MNFIVLNTINSILQYEYLYKRIKIYKDAETNFKVFKEKCAPRYKITNQQTNLIIELFDLVEKHKKSPLEFMRNGKIVILSENLIPKTFTFEKTKEFLELSKDILKKTKENFNKKF